ncbi:MULTISPECIES: ASCH domain-containing protein [Bizionia]|uniref:ASCH domain-containing protein n=1 Tax=Bizionia algoritergicola TaxID=291187 RepID=A0A5D0QLE4_9FLAO|nr:MULTISPECIES: hypothetical protein [Bizionia]OBX17737.1 hypothetical protein BAA08_15855 [Bizionia sp. APA-3]TYB69481.1 hypothetical protein ES675_16120 [Bizionia algoritergicola]
MKRMSFALTKAQILNQTKTVTRRNGWKNLKVGDLIQPIEKGMGLKKGEKQVLLGCPIKIIAIGQERLYQITQSEVNKEGFPCRTKEFFIEMFCKANKCDRRQSVTRIEFEYTIPNKE